MNLFVTEVVMILLTFKSCLQLKILAVHQVPIAPLDITRSPGHKFLTADPTATTSPTPSNPGVLGNGGFTGYTP